MDFIKRAFADVITTIGSLIAGVLILLLVLSLFFVRDIIPTASHTIWFFIIIAIVISLIVFIIVAIFIGISYISKIRASNRLRWLEVEKREIEVETFRSTNEHTRQQFSINTSVIDSNNNSFLLGSPTDNTVNIQTNNTPAIIYYKSIRDSIESGKVLIGIRPNSTLRIGTFEEDFKILLVLGMSSSGKTTTMVEKIVNAVRGRCRIIINDPHGRKNDSLINRIYPLKQALFTNTIFAIDHDDIVKNIRIAAKELDKRVKGGDCSIPVILVVEEWNRLMRDKEIVKELKYISETLGQEGRGFNMYAIFACQQITGNADLRKSIISVIVHRCDATESQLLIPVKYAKFSLELKNGYTFVRDANGVTEPLRQPYISLEDVQEIANILFTNIKINQSLVPSTNNVLPAIPNINPYRSLLNPNVSLWESQNTYELKLPFDNPSTNSSEISENINSQPTDENAIVVDEKPQQTIEEKFVNFVEKAKKDKKYF